MKIAQIAKTGLFESQVDALGSLGNNLATGFYWGPTWPYKSSLTGISNADLASGYEAEANKQWNQQLGPSMALFDVANAVAQGQWRPQGQGQGRKRDEDAHGGHAARARSRGARGRCRTWSPPRSRAASGSRAQSGRSSSVFCENSDDPNIPVAAKLVPYNA